MRVDWQRTKKIRKIILRQAAIIIIALAVMMPGGGPAWAVALLPDTGHSSVSATTEPASPVVGQNFTFTATVRDGSDNTMPTLLYSDFTVSGGVGTTLVTDAVYNSDADNYTVTATHDRGEIVTMAVNAIGVNIGSIADVNVVSGFAGGDGLQGTPYQIGTAE